MRAPEFWSRAAPGAAALALAPFGAVYGALTQRRMRGPRAKAGVPVICVGNFTAGGAGKTPAALALAAMLEARGARPFFLSRGYGGTLAGAGAPVRVDPARHSAAETGDEALLLARAAPVILSPDRVRGAAAARDAGASVIVMDDGLQSGGLAHDLAIAVIDGETGVGNGLCIPAGPLRAPLQGQWRFVDALIVIGAGAPGAALADAARGRGKAVLRAHLMPEPAAADALRGQRVLAFAGIGRPEKFFATLRALGAEVAAARAFADHHAYSGAEIAALRADAAARGLALVTTEKDFARLTPAQRDGVKALPVTLEFEDPEACAGLLARALSEARP